MGGARLLRAATASLAVIACGAALASAETVNSHYVAVRDNVFDLLDFGIVFGAGSSGKYMGNLASGVTVPYAGGTAAGTTNY